jgi:drug/metabolite transporter (DMT)-like permease
MRLVGRPIARLQVIAAALLFSTGGIAVKLTELTGWQVACLRAGLAALLLAWLGGAWRTALRPSGLLVGLAYAAVMVLFVLANKLTTAAHAIFLQSTAPFWVLLLGPRLLAEPVGRRDLGAGVAIAAGLLLLLTGSHPPLRTAPDPTLGNLLAAASGLAWALAILGLRATARADDRTTDSPVLGVVVVGNALACLFCLPFALPLAGGELTDWLVVAYLGAFQVALAYVWMARGLRRLPALEVSLLLLLEPVLSTGWAWLVLGERPADLALLGCALILAASLVRTLGASRVAVETPTS